MVPYVLYRVQSMSPWLFVYEGGSQGPILPHEGFRVLRIYLGCLCLGFAGFRNGEV